MSHDMLNLPSESSKGKQILNLNLVALYVINGFLSSESSQ